MAKTASELTKEELRSYHPWKALQRYREDPMVSSDIDLAVWGVPTEKFYRAIGAVMDLGAEAGFRVDIVDPAECSPKLAHNIRTEGIEL